MEFQHNSQSTREKNNQYTIPFPERILPDSQSSQHSPQQQKPQQQQQPQQLSQQSLPAYNHFMLNSSQSNHFQHSQPYQPTPPGSLSNLPDYQHQDNFRIPASTRSVSNNNMISSSNNYLPNPRAVPIPDQNHQLNPTLDRFLPVDTRYQNISSDTQLTTPTHSQNTHN